MPEPTLNELLEHRAENPVYGFILQGWIERELATRTDKQIGELLRDHVWAELSVNDPASALVSVAVDRLMGQEEAMP